MKRFQYKFEYIEERIPKLPIDPTDGFMLDTLYHMLQCSIESITDVLIVMCKDMVLDDYSNINLLVKSNILTDELGNNIKKLNSLRNIITVYSSMITKSSNTLN